MLLSIFMSLAFHIYWYKKLCIAKLWIAVLDNMFLHWEKITGNGTRYWKGSFTVNWWVQICVAKSFPIFVWKFREWLTKIVFDIEQQGRNTDFIMNFKVFVDSYKTSESKNSSASNEIWKTGNIFIKFPTHKFNCIITTTKLQPFSRKLKVKTGYSK